MEDQLEKALDYSKKHLSQGLQFFVVVSEASRLYGVPFKLIQRELSKRSAFKRSRKIGNREYVSYYD